jgi:hypothetical protein
VTLAWDKSPSTEVIGYKLYYGTSSGHHSLLADTGNQTSYTVKDLTDGKTYYFVVTAYDSNGVESSPSNEVSYYAPAVANIHLSASSSWSDFGTVTIDRKRARRIAIVNRGTASLDVGNIDFSGANKDDFAIDRDTCSGSSVDPGRSCFVVLVFQPASSGAKAANLVILSNDSDTSESLYSLAAIGGKRLVASADSVYFGTAIVGKRTSRVIRVKNKGITDINLYSLSSDDPTVFSIPPASDRCSGRLLKAGLACSVRVNFNPLTSGEVASQLHIPSDDKDSPEIQVSLDGKGK